MLTDRIQGGVAGFVGAGIALGLGELWAGLFGSVPSPLASVGGFVVDRSPAWLRDLAITVFGLADKTALAIGTVIIGLGVGWLAGTWAVERRAVAPLTFGVFALLGFGAAVGEPFAEPLPVAAATLVSAGLGLAAWGSLSGLETEPTDGVPRDGARRRFIGLSVAGGVGAVAAGVVGRRFLTSLPDAPEVLGIEEAGARVALPGPGNALDVPGISPIITPNEDFYRIDTALVVPRIDPSLWSLRVHGLVDEELTFSYDDLLGMDTFDQYVTLACVSNEVGGELVDNAVWTGVRLAEVLDRAGLQGSASQLVGRSIDDFTVGFPPELVFDGRDPMIALAMNGEPLPLDHGFPARLIVPGLYGYVSATKWLTEIELTTWEGFDAYWVPRGWAKEGPIKTQSRIDVPTSGDSFPAGNPVRVAGVAFAPYRGIEKVEVSVGDGDEWMEADVSDPLDSRAWVHWAATINLEEGFQNVRVRAIDGTGALQTSQPAAPRPDGAQGYHVIRIEGR